ncbi:MAG: AAA family ATPase [Thermodesulfobacteriota bacterium]
MNHEIAHYAMVPIRLSLKNFLSYGSQTSTLDFSEFSIACLTGRNGHGKSAILDALTWALWGKCRVTSNVEVIKRGESEATVEFEFEVEGNRYRILRQIKRRKGTETSTTLHLQYFNTAKDAFEALEQGAKTQKTIEDILKIDYDSFICSSFILQGRADEFMKKKPAERKAVLSKILDLEKYDTLMRKARDAASHINSEAEATGRQLEQITDEMERTKNLSDELKEKKQVLDNITTELGALERSRDELVRKSESLKAKRQKYNELTSQIEGAKGNSTQLRDQLGELGGTINADSQIVSREKEINREYKSYLRAKKQERAYSEKMLRHTKLGEELEKITASIRDEQNEIEKQLSLLEGRRRELNKTIAQKDEIIVRQSEIESGLKEYFFTLDTETELEERGKQTAALDADRRGLQIKLEEERLKIEVQAARIGDEIEQRKKKVEYISAIEQEVEELEKKIEEHKTLLREYEALELKLKITSENKKAAEARIEELKIRLAEDEDKLSHLTSEIEEPHCPLCESALTIEAAEALIEKLEGAMARHASVLEEQRSELDSLEARVVSLSEKIKGHQNDLEQLAELNTKLGEKKNSHFELVVARGELELLQTELSAINKRLDTKDYGAELQPEITLLEKQIKELDYDQTRHEEIKNKAEELRRFRSEKEALDKAHAEKSTAGDELRSVEGEKKRLLTVLNEEGFAEELRAGARTLEDEIKKVGYSVDEYTRIKDSVSFLERFSRDKEELERAKLSLAYRKREQQRINKTLVEVEDTLRRLGTEIEEYENIIPQTKEIEDKRQSAETQINKLRTIRDGCLSDISTMKSEIDRVKKMRKKKAELRSELHTLKGEVAIYKQLQRAFGKNGIQALIIENTVPEIEQEANNLLRKLSEGTMTLSLELVQPTQKGGEKETLQVKIADSVGTRSYETYSGGEAFRIDFALRVAISKFIANRSGAELRTLVIDEGFGTQDKDGLSHFVDVINTVKDDFDKILVITHVDELKDKFPVRIEVTKEYGKGSTFETIYN